MVAPNIYLLYTLQAKRMLKLTINESTRVMFLLSVFFTNSVLLFTKCVLHHVYLFTKFFSSSFIADKKSAKFA